MRKPTCAVDGEEASERVGLEGERNEFVQDYQPENIEVKQMRIMKERRNALIVLKAYILRTKTFMHIYMSKPTNFITLQRAYVVKIT